MGRPKGSKNVVQSTAGMGFNPSEVREAAADVLASLIKSRDDRTALYNAGYALIQLGQVVNYARHHRDLYEIAEEDLESLKMDDYLPIDGFKCALLSDVTALPNTRKV